MVSEWKLTTLLDIALLNMGLVDGPFGSNLPASLYEAKGIPVIRGNNLSLGQYKFKDMDFVFVSEDTFKSLKRSECISRDIIFTKKGTLGQTGIIPDQSNYEKYLLSSNQMRLRVDEKKAVPLYIYYCVSSKKVIEDIKRDSEHTGVPKINLGYLKSFKISLPPLKEQKAIAHILCSLDDKIELNRQMNATLEAMAQALFKSWFVDFDPVIDNALAAGNPIPEELQSKVTARLALGDARKPLPTDIHALFPSSFVLTEEMGWIPEGWEYQSLYEMANYVNGAAFKEKDFAVSEVALPIVKIAEIKSGITSQTKFSEKEYDPKYLINNGSILLSWSGNPDTSIDTFIWTGGLGWLNQHIFNVVLKESQDKYFVYYQLRELKPIFADLARDKQTTGLGHFTIKDMKKLAVLKPENQLLKAFNSLIGLYFERGYSNLLENQALARLRDTLLPKFLSGELRIPE